MTDNITPILDRLAERHLAVEAKLQTLFWGSHIIAWDGGLCVKLEGEAARVVVFEAATIFQDPAEAAQLAEGIFNGAGVKPRAKRAIKVGEICLAGIKEVRNRLRAEA